MTVEIDRERERKREREREREKEKERERKRERKRERLACILVLTTSMGVFPKTLAAPANPPENIVLKLPMSWVCRRGGRKERRKEAKRREGE